MPTQLVKSTVSLKVIQQAVVDHGRRCLDPSVPALLYKINQVVVKHTVLAAVLANTLAGDSDIGSDQPVVRP